jgi:aldose sugar dehydrogenase
VRKRTLIPALALAGLLAASLADLAPAATEFRARRFLQCRRANPLCFPTAFEFVPGARRLFYTEKNTGQIRLRNLRTGTDVLWARIPNVATAGSQGLLGLALDPAWPDDPSQRWVYAYYTEEMGSPDVNRIIRMRKQGANLVTEELLAIPGAVVPHNGGVLDFGPDGMLYAIVGDGRNAARAQDTDDHAGKMLRLEADGTFPSDNPFPDSPVWSFGHRNSFGFVFDARTGNLWETENGPECNDEVNLIVEGGNYAWGPTAACGSAPPPEDTNRDGPLPRLFPERLIRNTRALTGVTVCRRCGLGPRWNGDLIVGAFRPPSIRAFELSLNGQRIVGQRVLYRNPDGVMAVETGPGRTIYFSDMRGISTLVRA